MKILQELSKSIITVGYKKSLENVIYTFKYICLLNFIFF